MMFLLLTLALLTFTNAQLSLDLSLVGAARLGLAGVLTGDGQVVFAGGVTGDIGSTLSKAVDVISTVDNVVSAGAALSVSRYALAASTAANFSIFAGGISAQPLVGSATFSADVDVYDATTATWNTTTLAVARAYHCVGSTADYLYIAGGEVASGTYTDSVEVFVAATGQIDASLNFNLSVARAFLATATLDTTVYFAGGLNSSTEVTAVVDVYDTVNASLTTVELSEARQQIAAVAVGTQVFFAGGASASNVASATVDIWDSTTGNFTTAALSVARFGIRAVVVGDLVLFLGGYTQANVASAVVDMYNVTAQAWEKATVLAHARANFAAVAADNKVYLAGGVSAGLAALLTGSGSLEVLDFNPQNSTGIPTPTPSGSENLTVTIVTFANARASLAATVNGAGELLIGGGVGVSAVFTAISSIDITAPADAVDLSQLLSVGRLGLRAETAANVSVFAGGAVFSLVPSAAVDIYYAANNSWRTASLAVARVYHASAVVGTKIYFAGGKTATTFTNTIESYDTQTGAWVTLSATLSVGRGYLTASVVGDLIVFAGGRSGTIISPVVSDVVDVLDTVTGTVTSTTTLSVARAELAASVVGDLVLFGGGVEASGSASVVVDIWNSTAGAFLNATETFGSSVGRWALQAVTLGTDVYFVGGFDGTNAYATVDIYSSVTGTWTVKEITYPRYNFAATVDVNGNAYFCGGQSSSLNFLASVEIYGESSTGTPTPTPGETPTPTPVVVPTPTPGVTPTPTPGVNDCVTLCKTSFSQAQDSWTDATDFTVQCSKWDTLLTCLGACTNDNTGALADQTTTCTTTANIQYFCSCERSNFGFNASAAVLFISSNINNFESRFNSLPVSGIVSSPTSGTGTTITVDTNANTLTNTFTYEDSTGSVSVIEVAWSVDLALFFNTNADNFVVSQSKKRTQQSATLQVNVADNNNSGVSQLSVSFAFVLVTFLLHVLF